MAKRVLMLVLLAGLGASFFKPSPVFSEVAKVENTLRVDETQVMLQEMKHLHEQTVREAEWAKTFNTTALTISGILLGILALVGIAFTIIYTRRIRDLTAESRDFRDRAEKSMEKAEAYMERASAITQELNKRKTEMDETFAKQEEIIAKHVEQAVKKIDEEKERAARFNQLMDEARNALDERHHEAALEAVEKAMEIDENSYTAWMRKGLVLLRINRIEQSILASKRAVELNPNGGAALFNLACAYSKLNNKQEVIDSLARALELRPELKELAQKDVLLKTYRDDPDFRALVFDEESEG